MTASTDTPAIEIPIIDIAGYLAGDEAATLRAADQLRLALEKVGFFMISGHGVDWALVDKAYGGAERFFAQPVEVKERIGVPTFYDLKERLGYVGFAGEVRSGRTVDARVHLVEAFYFTAETDEAPSPRNNWPADLPGFRADLLAYFNAVQSLGLRLLPAQLSRSGATT